MRHLGSSWIGAFLIAAVASEAEAQRTLSWDELSVRARLDADGRLHVEETQVMVMSGDWNGGERRFTLAAGQELELHRLARREVETGTTWPLVRGDLSTVDRYDWADARTLRWRSRLPSDPVFQNTRLTYVLEYTYTNILQPRSGDEYALEHDFAFADRVGNIRRFTLDLDLDPAWASRGPVPKGVVVDNLVPGRSYVSRLALEYRGTGRPAGVDLWAPRVAAGTWAALVVFPLLFLTAAWWRERRVGRLDPLPVATRELLEQDVLSVRAEVIGAAWDEQVGAPEVAAVIARLSGEGKLESRVVSTARADRPEMALVRKRPLDDFEGYERHLLLALLLGEGREETSTSAIRRHYESQGFHPAAIIASELTKTADAFVGHDRLSKPSWLPGGLLFWGGVALLVLGGLPRAEPSPVWLVVALGLPISHAIGHAAASTWRRRVDWGPLGAVPVVILSLVPLLLAYAFVRFGGAPGWRSFTNAGVVAIALSLFVGVINAARSRRGPVSIRLRKRLCAVRRYFAKELRKPSPALEDSWFPYAVAFGLEKQVERWFGRFAGASASRTSSQDHSWSSSGSSSSSSSSSTPSTWSGGGGSFGGAGATGSWAAAVSGLAAGVAAPSSSSNGGGGGGGGGGSSSSGGGGGGGW
jgi:uncharacterized membrane protein YgcG